jgi:molybdopterin molybdotransferase
MGLLGQVLAEDVLAESSNPRFAMSAMDGWAIHPDDMNAGAGGLTVAGTVLAGMEAPKLEAGTTCAVMTGAPVPSQAAAVIPVEDVREDAGKLFWDVPLRDGQHIRAQGEDFKQGQLILPPGTRLLPQHLVLLRTAGVRQVKVLAPVAINLIQTGNELVEINKNLTAGSVYESTRDCLISTLNALGQHRMTCQQVQDTKEALKTALQQALGAGVQLILTTGGVSKGVADHVPDVAKALGATLMLHRLAIKPAKPLLVATFPSGAVLVGLPGNPISQLVALQAVVFPLLMGKPMLQGMSTIKATLTEPCAGKIGFRTFIRGRASVGEDGRLLVQPLTGNESHRVANLATCNAWLHVVGDHAAGSLLEVSPLLSTEWRLTSCLA